jgi:DNA polymerase III subunit beta
MKLTCTQENFKKAIYNTERVVGKQITLPILENVMLETDGGMLKISATNLEIGVFMKIGAKIEEEGTITVPAKLLSSFMNNLPAESTVSLAVSDQTLHIASGGYEAQIKGLGAQDFPIIPEMEGDYLFSIAAQELKENVPRLASCVSLDSGRPELTGINMVFGEQKVDLAATDSFRLAESIIPFKKENEQAFKAFVEKTTSIIIPLNTFLEVMRVIGNDSEVVKIGIEESQIFFQIENVRIVSRLINGKYPPYKQIIPASFSTTVIMDKEEVLRAVKIAGIFANNKTGEVKFTIDPGKIEVIIRSKAEEVGENQTKLIAEITGDAQEIVFNPRYMADGVQSVATPKLAMLANNGSSPAILRMIDPVKKEQIADFTYVIMPIKN